MEGYFEEGIESDALVGKGFREYFHGILNGEILSYEIEQPTKCQIYCQKGSDTDYRLTSEHRPARHLRFLLWSESSLSQTAHFAKIPSTLRYSARTSL